MADEQQIGKFSITSSLEKGMWTDNADSFIPEGCYTNAINATTVLPDGAKGGLSTECANRLSLQKAPFVLIGSYFLEQRKHVTFWTTNTISEVGIYDETTDTYTVLINDSAAIAAGDPGMNFNTTSLITARARRNYDCGFNIYWSDGGRNIDRVLDTQFLQPNPWFQVVTLVSPGCFEFTNTNRVDVRQLSLNSIYNIPCLTLAKGTSGGLLTNGSYQVVIAYTINGIKVSDYCALSNVQGIWNHTGTAGGLRLNLSNLEKRTFHEMEIVVISTVNSNVQAKRLGLYSTNTETLYIDDLQESLPTVPLENIPFSTPAIPSSDSMWQLGDYLVRTGVRERPDFNYQPLANQIDAQYVIVEYPEKYYHDGGYNEFPMNVGHMGGEVYAVFIRWRYTTGEVSASYPLIGPTPAMGPTFSGGGPATGDGGVTIASGTFDSYLSNEIYPDDKSSIWNSNIPGHPEWDVCGQQIRWFRFPDQTSLGGNPAFSHYWNYGTATDPDCRIRVKGWTFSNIQLPVDLNGNLIPDIQGYEFLRATRDGNMSVLACGMVNNMRTYNDNVGSNGVFSNYPFNDVRPDDYLTDNVANINTGAPGNGSNSKLTGFRSDLVSFHSPETVFGTPYLGPGQLKVLMGMGGVSHGHFVGPWKHPMFKVLTNFDSWLVNFITLIEVIVQVINTISTAVAGTFGAPPPDLSLAATEDIPMRFPLFATPVPLSNVVGSSTTNPGVYVLNAFVVGANVAMQLLMLPFQALAFRDQMLNVIKGLIPARQYALQYNASGFYSLPQLAQGQSGVTTAITDYSYILGNMQSFAGLTVNNLYRNKFVALQLSSQVLPLPGDNSRNSLGTSTQSVGDWRYNNIESYYTSYRIPQLTQYGQIDSTKQVPIGCMYPITPIAGMRFATGNVIFGGDTYVVRYTEQNPFLFFNDWLTDAPQDIKYDYRNYINVPYPMFWLNNDWQTFSLLALASDNRRLDGPVNTFTGGIPGSSNAFYVNYGYFYISCNGIRDFFVETTLNMGYRDYGDDTTQQFYNPYGYQEIDQLFRTDYVKTPIFYKYDGSLSAKNTFNQWLSWGVCLRRDYDPQLAFTCFNYYPRRTVYSLHQNEEQKVDLWRMFLPNNYVNTISIVRAIQSIGKSGGVFFMDDSPPAQLAGISTIPSSSGTDFSVGTGSLFAQGLQTLSNADGALQYGSCQGRFCSINTPQGLFWVSQRSGKVFQANPDGTDFQDITKFGNKFRLAQELPSKLLVLFPSFPLVDNVVDGVGVQLLYDNTNELLYICKRDFVSKVQVSYVDGVWYAGCPPGTTPSGYDPFTGKLLCVECFESKCPGVPITLGDPLYFDNAGWTLSYSPTEKKFVSWHRWTPTLSLSGAKHIITSLRTSLWKHNETTNGWCNYYGTQWEFTVEAPINAGQQVVTVENIEYILDSFRYRPNQEDKFNQYADTFNVAQVYNEELSTLPLFLIQNVVNNPFDRFNYPNIIGSGMELQYTKVENKFRFPSGNGSLRSFQASRGQFSLTTVQMKVTEPNGYAWSAQNLYYNFLKSSFETQKLRHRSNRVMMSKTDLTVNSLSLYAIKSNVVISPR